MLAELPRENDVVDLMPLAYRVPLMIVGDLLGAPAGDREQIHSWSRRIAGNLGTYEVETLLDAHAAYREFSAYVDSLVAGHRGRSGESTDLVSALVGAEEEQRLTTQDLVSMFIVLLFAGHETTSNLISIGLYELLRRRDEWAQLTADPTVAAAAVEELLRFVSPVQWNLRQAMAEVDVRGVRIRAGQDVQVILASANRDPEVFKRPDELDLDRPDAAQHIAFGYGAHFCLGSALARLEGRIVLGTLAARYPELTLATENLEWTGTANLRRLRALPVRLGAR
jgi:cytochrome P450